MANGQQVNQYGVSLRDFFEARMRSLEEATKSHMEGHEREHRALADALTLQAKEIERRLEGLNELRQQVVTDRGDFARRDMLDQRFKTVDSDRVMLRDRLGALEGRFLGIGLAATALSAIAVVVSVAVQ